MSNDIAKCPGIIDRELCLNRERCLRFTIKADDLWQAWMTPSYGSNKQCRDFINNYKDEKKREAD
jgi:hypothetical protein